MVFWGGLLCVIDFKFNGFDIAPDLVGIVLLIWGVASLANLQVNSRYRKLMRFVRLIAFLVALQALIALLPGPKPEFVSFFLTLINLAAMIATVVFCVSMRHLSNLAGLDRSAQSWKLTMVLFFAIYLVPLGLFYTIAAVCTLTNQTFNLNINGASALLILPIFLLPVIHLFISTSRMKREAEARVHTDEFEKRAATTMGEIK